MNPKRVQVTYSSNPAGVGARSPLPRETVAAGAALPFPPFVTKLKGRPPRPPKTLVRKFSEALSQPHEEPSLFGEPQVWTRHLPVRVKPRELGLYDRFCLWLDRSMASITDTHVSAVIAGCAGAIIMLILLASTGMLK